MKVVQNWEELAKCTSESHTLDIDLEMESGWIMKGNENVAYLSTHSFYESTCKSTEALLNQYGFNVKIVSWG